MERRRRRRNRALANDKVVSRAAPRAYIRLVPPELRLNFYALCEKEKIWVFLVWKNRACFMYSALKLIRGRRNICIKLYHEFENIEFHCIHAYLILFKNGKYR